jgi:vitamin B12/bleomycin/antimicrobial peptide transport system ATP-binding/permease protein
MILIGRRLTKVIEESKRTEGELRSIGAHLRERSEGSTLPDDEKGGRRIIGAALDQVIAQWLALCWQNMRMTCSRTRTICFRLFWRSFSAFP